MKTLQRVLTIAIPLLLLWSKAYPTTINFAGQIGSMGADFGLGLQVGDPFSGSFADDGSALQVTFNSNTFVALSPTMLIMPFDGFLAGIDVQGQIEPGLWLHIGLTNGEAASGFDCEQWFHCGLQIKASSFPAIEIGWGEPAAIRALNNFNNSHPEIFSFVPTVALAAQVPEPASWLLVVWVARAVKGAFQP